MNLPIPDELLDEIADRVADRLASRLHAAQPQPPVTPWLTASEAAEYLRCGKQRLYNLKAAGRIPYHREGDRLLFHRRELEEWLDSEAAQLAPDAETFGAGDQTSADRVATPLPAPAEAPPIKGSDGGTRIRNPHVREGRRAA
jgi:excisionase family DNA binding protein